MLLQRNKGEDRREIIDEKINFKESVGWVEPTGEIHSN